MIQETYTKAEKFAEWDAMGEEVVRTKFNLGHFGGDKSVLAKMWLDGKDQDRSDALEERKHASNSESLRIARSAKNAAWIAAISAMIAIVVSVIALVRSSP